MKTNVIRIFISSTFNDMQEERDYILNNIYPRLRNIAQDNGLKLVFVDLRWGILDESDVITTCFKEIDDSRPFFIGILGHRYGSCAKYQDVFNLPYLSDKTLWLERFKQGYNNPNKEISYTELEFLYGFLEQTRKDLRVLLLSKAPCSFDDPNITQFKARIQKDGRYPIHPYSGKENLGKIIEKSIEKLISEIKPEIPTDQIEAELFRQNYLIEQHVSGFVKSKAYNKLLDSFLSGFAKNHLFLYGEEGCGKTSFMANLNNDIKHKTKIKTLFCSLDFMVNPTCTQLVSVLDRLLSNFIDNSINSSDLKIEATIVDVLKKKQLLLPPQKSIYIFVDAIDKLKEDDRFQLYGIIREAPTNIRYILSYSQRDNILNYNIPNQLQIEFPPYSETEIEQVISSYLPLYGKELLDLKKSEIANSVHSKNLFLLRLWLDDLLAYGYNENLNQYITEVAQSKSSQQFLEIIFSRYENAHDFNLVANILCTIAVCPYGISEYDLLMMIKCPNNSLLKIIGAFRAILVRRDDLYFVSDSRFIAFIKNRYKDNYKDTLDKIIAYFEHAINISFSSKSNFINNLLELYLDNNILSKLEKLLLEPIVFCMIYKADDSRLERYWNALIKEDGINCVESYLDCIVPEKDQTDFFLNLFFFYMSTVRNYDCALTVVNRLIDIAPSKELKIDYLSQKARIYIEKNDYELCLHELIPLIKEISDCEDEIITNKDLQSSIINTHLSLLSNFFLFFVDVKMISYADSVLNTAFEYLNNHKVYISENDYNYYLYTLTNNLGKLFQEQGDEITDKENPQKEEFYRKGIEAFSMSKGIVDKLFDISFNSLLIKGSLFYNAGVLYARLKEFKDACELFSLSNDQLAIISNNESLRMMACNYFNRALCESDLNLLDKAIDSFSQAIIIINQCKDKESFFLSKMLVESQFYMLSHRKQLGMISEELYQQELWNIIEKINDVSDGPDKENACNKMKMKVITSLLSFRKEDCELLRSINAELEMVENYITYGAKEKYFQDALRRHVELVNLKLQYMMNSNYDISHMRLVAEKAHCINGQCKKSLAIALNHFALIYYENEKYNLALKDIDKALKLDSSFAEMFETKGQILLAIGDTEGALKQWKTVLRKDPCYVEHHSDDSDLYYKLREKGLVH